MLKRILFALILSPLGSSIFALDCPSVPNTESFFPDSWGIDEANTRFVTSEDSQIDSENVHLLKLKWSYGLSTTAPRFYPLVTPDTIYIGDGENGLVALDRESGCVRWRWVCRLQTI